MKTFVTANELARRINVAPATLKSRMNNRGVEMDGVVINGTRQPVFIFDSTRLPELRRVLTPVEARIV